MCNGYPVRSGTTVVPSTEQLNGKPRFVLNCFPAAATIRCHTASKSLMSPVRAAGTDALVPHVMQRHLGGCLSVDQQG
jgi:hypothetical protein